MQKEKTSERKDEKHGCKKQEQKRRGAGGRGNKSQGYGEVESGVR